MDFQCARVGEAADTGPFFHNNSVSTIEGAVRFTMVKRSTTPCRKKRWQS